MLQNTFCHMPGIGPKTERRLWEEGILSWRLACDPGLTTLSGRVAEVLALSAEESIARLDQRNARYFSDRLPSREHWRMFPEFRHSVAYLDIETTGLGAPGDYITVVGLYDGSSVRHYVYDDNLDKFWDDIGDYELIVTYSGKTFDVPFIRHYLGVRMDQAHIDLRYVLRSLGYRGGLKGCEKQLGMDRGELEGIDGYFAVLLWRDFRRNGNRGALETLLAYNTADIVNLEVLMVLAYNMKLRGTMFAESHRLALPSGPDVPYEADLETVKRIKRAVRPF